MQVANLLAMDISLIDPCLVQNIQLDRNKVNIQGLYIDRSNKVITIPDVFHQLHCLVSCRLSVFATKNNICLEPDSNGALRSEVPKCRRS